MAPIFPVAFDGILASLPSQLAPYGIPSYHKQRVGWRKLPPVVGQSGRKDRDRKQVKQTRPRGGRSNGSSRYVDV